MQLRRLIGLSFVGVCILGSVIQTQFLVAQDPPLTDGTADALKKIPGFRVPAGLKIELFAAEPKLSSPVAIGLDEQNRVFVAEEYRFNRGTEENRTRPFLLEDDLQAQTLDDRLAMYKKHVNKFDGGLDWFRKHSDLIRRLVDTDGDGRADQSTVFADKFNDILDGMASGVMIRDGDVYVTNIPHLWKLKDTDGDGVADERKSLHTGFGVCNAFLGHDLHGMVWGPDGRLYFSIGDRGFHVVTQEGRVLHGPRTGAVFRCNPDGSELEVVARGLRNPQELAFDQFGNLFAADNNCDKGDQSRLVYILEGGDSGWNMAFQTIPAPYLTGPWHAEKMWHVPPVDQPAWLLPPVGPLGAGPSGFCYYPGTGLPAKYDHHFFLCNYTGNGGVESFSIKPRGAGFEIIDAHDFFKPISATDCEFGYDGKMYVSDFVKLNWDGSTGGGRIYTVFNPEIVASETIRDVKTLFREGFAQRKTEELVALLAHADMRVRQRSQFALAARGKTAIPALEQAMAKEKPRMMRLHALWALGQISRTEKLDAGDPHVTIHLMAAVQDVDEEIRGQAIKLIGESPFPLTGEFVKVMAGNTSPRVRSFIATTVGKKKATASIAMLVGYLEDADNKDPWLRHAVVTALANIGDRERVQKYANDPSPAVRLGVLLAQRRWNDPALRQFLNDKEPQLVLEAARAIHDLPLNEALPELAGLLSQSASSNAAGGLDDVLVRRVINSNFRLGDEKALERVASLAIDPRLNSTMRQEALTALRDWAEPPPRDRVLGDWRPLPVRIPQPVQILLTARLTELLAKTPRELLGTLLELVQRHQLPIDENQFAGWVRSAEHPISLRAAALRLLVARKSAPSNGLIDEMLTASEPLMRAEARELRWETDPDKGSELIIAAALNTEGAPSERQRAIAKLAAVPKTSAVPALEKLVAGWSDGSLPATLHLETSVAIDSQKSPELRTQRDSILSKSNATAGTLSPYLISLEGGDVDRGRSVFLSHAIAQCVRCHKVGGEPGGTAGPNLEKVASRHDRLSLLQSIVEPNAKIAPGFGSVAVVLDSGKVISGLLKLEDEQQIVIEPPDGQPVKIAKSTIDERTVTKSPMPDIVKQLSLFDLRDLVAYLATLK